MRSNVASYAHVIELWIVVVASALGMYLWRGLGVVLSGRIRLESELFNWIGCVAYAMIAGLVSRILIMPTGMLAETALADRLAACVLALAVYQLSRRNLFFAMGSGVAALVAASSARAVWG